MENTHMHSQRTGTLTYAQTHFTSFLPCFNGDCADTNTPLTHCHPHICAHTSNITSPGTHTKRHKHSLPLSLSLSLFLCHRQTHTSHTTAIFHMRETPDVGQQSQLPRGVSSVPAVRLPLCTVCLHECQRI